MNILILGGGTQSFALESDIKKTGHRVVPCDDIQNYADTSQYDDEKVYTEYRHADPIFLGQVKHCSEEHHIDTIIPKGDMLAAFFSSHKSVWIGKKDEATICWDTKGSNNSLERCEWEKRVTDVPEYAIVGGVPAKI